MQQPQLPLPDEPAAEGPLSFQAAHEFVQQAILAGRLILRSPGEDNIELAYYIARVQNRAADPSLDQVMACVSRLALKALQSSRRGQLSVPLSQEAVRERLARKSLSLAKTFGIVDENAANRLTQDLRDVDWQERQGNTAMAQHLRQQVGEIQQLDADIRRDQAIQQGLIPQPSEGK
jgi:hypothetical protein